MRSSIVFGDRQTAASVPFGARSMRVELTRQRPPSPPRSFAERPNAELEHPPRDEPSATKATRPAIDQHRHKSSGSRRRRRRARGRGDGSPFVVIRAVTRYRVAAVRVDGDDRARLRRAPAQLHGRLGDGFAFQARTGPRQSEATFGRHADIQGREDRRGPCCPRRRALGRRYRRGREDEWTVRRAPAKRRPARRPGRRGSSSSHASRRMQRRRERRRPRHREESAAASPDQVPTRSVYRLDGYHADQLRLGDIDLLRR